MGDSLRGAEAVLERVSFISRLCVRKTRMAKGYRVKELDGKLRTERTRSEARLLHKAKLAQVPCPAVLKVGEFDITMNFIEGRRPKMDDGEARSAGGLLALLHGADIIHGDYTPANLIAGHDGVIYVIDFGLGYVSNDVEDKAVDVFTMLRALGESGGEGAKESFISGYSSYAKSHQVLERVKGVEKRVRYAV